MLSPLTANASAALFNDSNEFATAAIGIQSPIERRFHKMVIIPCNAFDIIRCRSKDQSAFLLFRIAHIGGHLEAGS
jgi:hypothetical protein